MKKYFTSWLCLSLLIPVWAAAQTSTYYPNTPIGDNISGYYEFLPEGYNSTTEEFPLLIFIHGIGLSEDRDPPSTVYNLGSSGYGTPTYMAAHGWSPFTAGNEDGAFILITPLWVIEPYRNNDSQVENIEDLINYSIANYRVDTTRIYLAGQSSGGAYVMEYVSESLRNAKRIAAVLASSPAFYVSQEKANIIAESNLPLWMSASEFDVTVSPTTFYRDLVIGWYNAILNAPNPPLVSPKYSIVPGEHGHNDAAIFLYDPATVVDGLNAYEWLKVFQRAFPAPVTGFELQAVQKENSVLLSWQTATEVNSKEFQVQRSTDGIYFESIATIPPKHSGQQRTTYQFRDQEPGAGALYYRIRQLDINGRTTFSNIVAVSLHSINGLRFFPNPVESILTIEYDHGFNNAVLSIYDSRGRLCLESKLSGAGAHQVNVQHLPKGMYHASIPGDKKQIKFTFLKN